MEWDVDKVTRDANGIYRFGIQTATPTDSTEKVARAILAAGVVLASSFCAIARAIEKLSKA